MVGLAAFVFAVAFMAGTMLWTGFGFAQAIFEFIRRIARGYGREARPRRSGQLVPLGYGWYVVTSLLAGIGVGVLSAVASELALTTGVALWVIVGGGLGAVLWSLAHHGWLPFLVPEYALGRPGHGIAESPGAPETEPLGSVAVFGQEGARCVKSGGCRGGAS